MSDDARIEALVEALKPGLGDDVERIDTHAAIVLLAGEHAFKLKKPVRYSFLDFATLEARRQALETELELNRRTAPELYLDVLPVTQTGEDVAIGGDGEPVEWVLKMKRFPQENRLDHVAHQGGGLELGLIERLARRIAAFHRDLEPLYDKGGLEALRQIARGNAEDLSSSVPDLFEATSVEALSELTSGVIERQAGLIEARREAGKVRLCHGDLHLGNIVLIDGEPVLFDCIEFNRDFASIDILYDLAFLVMDLVERGLKAEAQHVLQVWNDAMVEDEGLALLPLFISLRAAIRAKVEAFAGNPIAANTYLTLALEALDPPRPRLIAIGGRSGTGKSTVARALAPGVGAMPGAVLLRSDIIRKGLMGVAPTEKLPERAYNEEVSEKVFATMAERAETLIKAGRTVIADGVFGRDAQRERIETAARNAGVPFHGFWLEAAEEVLEARVAGRTGDASDADVAIVRRQGRSIDAAGVRWPRLDAAQAPEALAERIVALSL